jgi:hypothetical protein
MGEWRVEFISNTELNTYINESLYKFYAIMSAKDPLRYLKQETLTITSGTFEYDLPSDFFKLSGIAVERDGYDGYYVIDSFKWNERYNLDYTSTREGTKYIIKGSTGDTTRDGYYQVQLLPVPTFSGPMVIDYIPAIQDLDSDNDTFDTISGVGFNWVCADVAIKCATKEQTDTTDFEKMKAEAQVILLEISQLDTPETNVTKASNTLQSIQRSIRGRGPWERDAFTDTQLTEYINSSISFLKDTLVNKDNSHFLNRKDISILPGTKEYSLPTDFYKLLGAAVHNITDDGYYVLNRFNWDERYDDLISYDKYCSKYEVRNGKICLYPTPQWSDILRVEYIPKTTPLVNPGDTFEYGSYWVEWVILDCSIKCSAVAGTDPQIFMAQKSEIEEKIINVSTVDVGKPKRVVDYKRSRVFWSKR